MWRVIAAFCGYASADNRLRANATLVRAPTPHNSLSRLAHTPRRYSAHLKLRKCRANPAEIAFKMAKKRCPPLLAPWPTAVRHLSASLLKPLLCALLMMTSHWTCRNHRPRDPLLARQVPRQRRLHRRGAGSSVTSTKTPPGSFSLRTAPPRLSCPARHLIQIALKRAAWTESCSVSAKQLTSAFGAGGTVFRLRLRRRSWRQMRSGPWPSQAARRPPEPTC